MAAQPEKRKPHGELHRERAISSSLGSGPAATEPAQTKVGRLTVPIPAKPSQPFPDRQKDWGQTGVTKGRVSPWTHHFSLKRLS